jgi:hypothetical protein
MSARARVKTPVAVMASAMLPPKAVMTATAKPVMVAMHNAV